MKSRMMRSFHTKIFMTVLCVSLVPVILCFALFLPVLLSASGHSQNRRAQQQLGAISAQMGEAFLQMRDALDALADSPGVLAAMHGQAEDGEIYREMVNTARHAPALTQMMLLSPQGECLCALRGDQQRAQMDTDWGVLRMAQGETTVYYGEQSTVQAARRLAGGAGYVLAQMDGDVLGALLSGGRDAASGVMLLSAQWRLIDDSQAIGSEDRLHALRERLLLEQPLADGDSMLAYSTAVEPVSGFTLLLSQPRVFTGEMTHMLLIIGILLGVLSLLLCARGALVLSRSLARPVHEMTAAMRRVERGDLSVHVTPVGDDELGELAFGFNRMVEKYGENLRRSVERQKELNDTRIRMMRAQLNPHFLYNTLDSMKWIGISHGVPQVATLAQDLAGILRTSISGEEFVTLEQELELLERYIDIQLIRFEDRFACEIEVDDALMRLMVPKLVLQPIVENAIIHGVRDMDDGYIKIWAQCDADELCLYVQDNGRGMDCAQDGALSFGVSGKPGEHLGMYNVDSILRLHFGQAYGLSVRSRPAQGCLVMARMPRKEQDKEVC